MAARRHWSSVQGTRRLLLRLRGRVGIGAGEMPAINENQEPRRVRVGVPLAARNVGLVGRDGDRGASGRVIASRASGCGDLGGCRREAST